jgi:phosphatidylglycerol:prolipoprotein diacylglycerol transferase
MIDPVVFSLGPLSIRWYGVFAAAGMLVFYYLQILRAKRYGCTDEMVSDLTFTCMLAGIIGARLAYVLRFWSAEFAGRGFFEVFKVWQGGLVFQGGFIAAALAAIVLCRVRKWPLAKVADLVSPALPAGHAVARIGCLLNGCCFGFPYDGPLAVVYPSVGNTVLAIQKQQGVIPVEATACAPTFPVAGLESFCNLLLCLLLLWLEKKSLFRGRLFLLYMLLYSALRFGLEFFRGDYLHKSFLGLTPAQTTSLWVLAGAGIFWLALAVRQRTKARNSDASRPAKI